MLPLRPPDVNGLKTNKNLKRLVKALGHRKDQHIRGPPPPRSASSATPAPSLLITVIRNDAWRVREAAAAALVKIGAHAVGPLTGALDDQEEHERLAAAGALGQIGDPRAVEPLIVALPDQSVQVRQGCRRSPLPARRTACPSSP